MKLKVIYEKIYDKFHSVSFFAKIMDAKVINKLLQYEVISYLFFGVLTTVVNFIVFGLTKLIMPTETVLFTLGSLKFLWLYVANAIAWVLSVLFAYITNKLFVFESSSKKSSQVFKEITTFFGARILSFLLFEELLFGVIASLLSHLNNGDWIAKLIVAVFVVVFNYVASKLLIFRKKKDETVK